MDPKYRTSAPHIFAAGDIIGFPALASAAMEQARVAMCHAFDLKYKTSVSTVLPYGVWTVPEIATVGLGEDEARTKGTASRSARRRSAGTRAARSSATPRAL